MSNLQEKKWKKFLFSEIFDIKGGFYNKKPEKEEIGTIPFIGATDSNNGITQFNTISSIDKTTKTGDNNNTSIGNKIFKGNCIVVTNNGSVGYAYYQQHPFTCSHDVNPLYLKNQKMTKELAYFLIGAIEKQRVCFTYIHKWRPKRMKKSSIMLPVDLNNNPDYVFMEEYMKELEERIINKQKDYIYKQLNILGENIRIKSLNECQWKKYNVKDIFEIVQRGKRLKTEDHISGDIPYVSSTALNNGVDRFIGNNNNVRKFKDCLSLANSGSVGSCFYEPFEFIASDHITHLKNNSFNKYHYLFMATMLNRLSDKYNFNREINDTRISKEIILLPVKDDNTPDYDYMEQYIKNVMIDKYNKLLEFINS